VDQKSFDHLTRLLGGAGNRRGVFGALLGAGLLGIAGTADAASKRRRRQKRRLRGQAQPGLRDCPNPGPGKNLTNCDFSGQDLRGKSLRGANLSGASFASANLCGTDLRGANLQRTDFTTANLTRVDFRGTNLSTARLDLATFCQTRLPNGTLDNSGCPSDGEVCCVDAQCPPGAICQRGSCLNGGCINVTQICTSATPCCSNAQCVEVAPNFGLCQLACQSDADCPNGNLACRADVFLCPGEDRECCLRKACASNADCPSGRCCEDRCCQANETCGPLGFCVQTS
jgi:hypothetical protein